MIANDKLKKLKNHFIFIANLMIVSNFINYFLVNETLFDHNWLLSSFGLIITYIIFTLCEIKPANVNDKNYLIEKSKKDALKYFILFTLSHLLINLLKNKGIKISLLWFMQILLTIGAYVFFEYIFCDITAEINEINLVFLNLSKILLSEILGIIIIFGGIDLIESSDLIAYSVSYLVWSLIIKKYLLI